MNNVLDPASLPSIQFADPDPAPIIERMTAMYTRDTGLPLYPASPERLLINTVAYELSVLLGKLDYTGKQNLWAYAAGPFADQLAAFYQVTRLPAKAAICMQRFYAVPGLNYSVTIPAGIRVTPDSQLFFATDKTVAIPPQNAFDPEVHPYVDVAVTCLTPGVAGNGFLPGQITELVDPSLTPHVDGTSNISITEGGADVESDERLMQRCLLVPDEASTAGPEGAYRSITMGVNQLIVDVAVLSPNPCYIEIYPLLQGGALPDAALLQKIAEALSPLDVRPQGDRVTVAAPSVVEYAVQGQYFIDNSRRGLSDTIQSGVQQALAGYIAWQSAVLGRDINPDKLISMAQAAGAKRLVLATPEFAVVADKAVALAGEVSLTFGGFESA
jgi:phage-related baseplate assembly protein